MKTKKIIGLLSITFLMLGLLAACGSDQTSGSKSGEKSIVVGAAMPVFDDKWLSYLYDGIKEYDSEHDNVKVKMVDAKNDAGKQFSQVETFIVQQVDVILINPVETDAVGPMVDAANEADIPVVIVNRMPDEEVMKKIYAYVGSESIEAGTIQMEKVVELLGGKGNVAILNGTLGQESVVNRTKGNKDVLKKNPDMKLVREQTGDYQRSLGMTVMENWIQAGDEIDAIVANNDEMAIGAIMALEEANKRGDIIVAGIDGTIDALEYVKQGKLNISAFQDAYGQGKGAIEAAIKAVNGEKLDNNFINIPFELVTQDNVDEYIKKWEK
ncbi:sugar ABC transporter substrate-binding protein [Peribacillus psychrosaccharolyticus]|uniref:Sugar ABC transporter substrate-binding protein n=2 Tax=Peribacillus psychrosaccharolyticus TaxID=1407 RepID=A0A974S1V9_PERPY|nr:sugar ABC transporter substrate-binding protein [Peribacillus psychrosaccharolyticus]MEC2057691.1 sugar ABC transporter substrate-binding protein [Peribacillus psychrosaccharolyticus]MED3746381.1 sugar ABC transporter substrate-binding protein [Peribacillus psychrosaccharolyticus]QQT01944.1 sugar ABC transporter substrate-binding protein [Peribacillus psychrosaccharolyticus]